PRFWFIAFLIWFAVLWGLSSISLNSGHSPPIDHFDKVQHFGYFFGGSGLLCAWLFRRNPERPDWKRIFTVSIVVLSLVGALDEYHQSFTPGRSGNDLYDWLADFLGAIAGAFTFRKFHAHLK
ncbi:MAG: hypothetical protein EOP88_28250, partial [Verrucomicrobiaceae bacterium]